MDLEEAPLLHEPDLMLAVLRVGSRGEATPCECIGHLRGLREQAHEPAPVDETDLRRRLDTTMCKLARARLIERLPDSRFRVTPRGRDVLAANPRGVDDTVLMQFDEFRAALAHKRRASRLEDPLNKPYEEGFGARHSGMAFSENPYPVDSCAHQHWANGWSQGRDEEQRRDRWQTRA